MTLKHGSIQCKFFDLFEFYVTILTYAMIKSVIFDFVIFYIFLHFYFWSFQSFNEKRWFKIRSRFLNSIKVFKYQFHIWAANWGALLIETYSLFNRNSNRDGLLYPATIESVIEILNLLQSDLGTFLQLYLTL